MNRLPYGPIWSIDIVLVPIVGLWFFALSLWMLTSFDEINFEGQLVKYAQEPGKFLAIGLGGAAIGLVCFAYAAARYYFTRSSVRSPTSSPS